MPIQWGEPSIMDKFHLMTVFVAVAEEQSFSAAARRLSLSAPAVTRAISALEAHLKVKLLIRTTRHVRTTQAGHHYLLDAKRILLELEFADESAAGIHSSPKGELNITAPSMFGRLYITPIIVAYLKGFPDVNVNALFLDRVVNLVEEGQDIAVRIGELADSSLRAIKVGDVRHLLCASPDYLKLNGIPLCPDDLLKHQIIVSKAGNGSCSWQFEQQGVKQLLKLKPRLSMTTNDAVINAAVSGFGITRVLSYQVAEEINSGALCTVLTDFECRPLPIHIVHQQGTNVPNKVRAFINLASIQLGSDTRLKTGADAET